VDIFIQHIDELPVVPPPSPNQGPTLSYGKHKCSLVSFTIFEAPLSMCQEVYSAAHEQKHFFLLKNGIFFPLPAEHTMLLEEGVAPIWVSILRSNY
jgi:hypothetical protein